MAKRLNRTKINSAEVQGEGSFVVIVPLTVRQIRQNRKEAKNNPNFDMFENGLTMLAELTVDWDWVGSDGELLPLPKDNPEVLDQLTETEALFIINHILGVDESKN